MRGCGPLSEECWFSHLMHVSVSSPLPFAATFPPRSAGQPTLAPADRTISRSLCFPCHFQSCSHSCFFSLSALVSAPLSLLYPLAPPRRLSSLSLKKTALIFFYCQLYFPSNYFLSSKCNQYFLLFFYSNLLSKQ